MLDQRRVGLAGELRVMSELLLRGFNPAKSFLDNGVDIILENGIRIQVKTCLKERKVGNNSSYLFQLRKGEYKDRILVSTYADFLICVGWEDNLFLIIPSNEINNITTLGYYPRAKDSKYTKYLNNWNLLNNNIIGD